MSDDPGPRTKRMLADHPRIPKAHEMYVNAREFLGDATRLGDCGTAGPFVLLIHAVELALKSWLHGKGIELSKLRGRSFGHDLVALLGKARELGLVTCHPDTDAVIERLKKASDNARLRYEFEYELPSFPHAKSVADGILRAVKPPALGPVVWVGDRVTNHPV